MKKNTIDKCIDSAIKSKYSIQSVQRFFELYDEDLSKYDHCPAKAVEKMYLVWLGLDAAYKAGELDALNYAMNIVESLR